VTSILQYTLFALDAHFQVTCLQWTPHNIPEDLNRHVLSLSQENAFDLHSVGRVPSHTREGGGGGGVVNVYRRLAFAGEYHCQGLLKTLHSVPVLCASYLLVSECRLTSKRWKGSSTPELFPELVSVQFDAVAS
jgi:hypothetical protein